MQVAHLTDKPKSTYSLPTVTLHVAMKPPEMVLAVIVAEPSAIPVTTPYADTVATALLLEVQMTLGYAPDGATAAVKVFVAPIFR